MKLIKICGINDEAFAVAAATAGVDFLGFIFAAKSPRRISSEKAQSIRAKLSTLNSQLSSRIVGVFVEQGVDDILEIARKVPLDVVQLHSPKYTEADVASLKSAGYEVWRLDAPGADVGAADAILIDGSAAGVFGGTGRLADWSRIDELKRAGRRIVLAGGIGSANIAAALATAADIIDINSMLEPSPGCKSITRLNDLMKSLSTHG